MMQACVFTDDENTTTKEYSLPSKPHTNKVMSKLVFKSVADVEIYATINKEKLIVTWDGKNVLDVSDFKNVHPGGAETLEDFHVGSERNDTIDIKDAFDAVGHKDSSRRDVDKYIIGTIDAAAKDGVWTAPADAPQVKHKAKAGAAAAASKEAARESPLVTAIYATIGAAVVGIAVGVYLKYIKK